MQQDAATPRAQSRHEQRTRTCREVCALWLRPGKMNTGGSCWLTYKSNFQKALTFIELAARPKAAATSARSVGSCKAPQRRTPLPANKLGKASGRAAAAAGEPGGTSMAGQRDVMRRGDCKSLWFILPFKFRCFRPAWWFNSLQHMVAKRFCLNKRPASGSPSCSAQT